MNLNDLDCSQIMDRINDTANEMQDRVASKILAEYEYKNQHDPSTKIDKLSENLKEPLERQMNAVESIAESAKTQANLATEATDIAKQEAKTARHDAIFSKVISIIAIIISIATIVVPLIY